MSKAVLSLWILISIIAPALLPAPGIHLDDELPLQISSYPLHPGFPITLDQWIERATPAIADLDHNGSQELLLPTWGGSIYAWDSSGSLLPGFPIVTGGRIKGRLALADLNQDGRMEIVAGVESRSQGVGAQISIWQSDGTPLPGWPQATACSRSTLYCGVASIAIAEMDGEPTLEVIAATDNGTGGSPDPGRVFPAIYIWHSNGELFEGTWPVSDEFDVRIGGAIAIGDLDGDSFADIVTGRDYNRLFAYDRHGGNLLGWPLYVWWPIDRNNWDDDQIEFARSAVTLADLDEDGSLEYIVNGLRRYADNATYYNTDLLIYTPDGARWENWETPASGAGLLSQMTWRMLEAPAIGDINGDHQPDIVVSTQDGWIRAYTSTKQLLWEVNYTQGEFLYATEPVIGDIDGDGWNEVSFGTFDPNFGAVGPVGVWIIRHDGSLEAGTPLWVPSPGINGAPALSDLDSDGLIEIVATTITGLLYAWDAPGVSHPAHLPWPMARHDLQRTGHYINLEPNLTHSVKYADNHAPLTGDIVHYTIHVINTGALYTDTFQVVDIVPAGLSYVPGSLAATHGLTDDSHAPTLEWTGSLWESNQVDITYSVTVTQTLVAPITNVASIISEPGGQLILQCTIIVDGQRYYLPIVYR